MTKVISSIKEVEGQWPFSLELQLIDHILTAFAPDYSTKDLATISEDEFKLLLDKITSSHIAYTLHNRLAKEANNDLT